MIQCILGAKGGVGTSTVSQNLAFEDSKTKRVLLLDGSFKERSQEVLNQVEDQGAFDFFDYLSNRTSIEDSTISIKKDCLDLLPASATHDLDEIEKEDFLYKCSELSQRYDKIIVDLSRWSDISLSYWSEVAEEFLIVSTTEKLSLRGIDRINFLCFKEKIKVEKRLLINKISNEEEKEILNGWVQGKGISIEYYIPLLKIDENNCPIIPENSIFDYKIPLEKKGKRSFLQFLLGGKND